VHLILLGSIGFVFERHSLQRIVWMHHTALHANMRNAGKDASSVVVAVQE